MKWLSDWSKPRARTGWLASRPPVEVARLIGRVALWALIALLLVRGAADVLASDGRPGPRPVAAERTALWPDERARAFAAGFARAFLSYSPKRPLRYVRGLRRFMAPELVQAAVPAFPKRAPDQLVAQTVVAGEREVGEDRASITVAVGLAGSQNVRFLVVPIARDARGALVVDELPSFTPATSLGAVRQDELEPLDPAEQAELEPIVSRFFGAFLAGDAAELEYLVPAGKRIDALSPALGLVGVDRLGVVSRRGGERVIAVDVRARDSSVGAVYRLRYRVALVRADRWYVASVNESPKEG